MMFRKFSALALTLHLAFSGLAHATPADDMERAIVQDNDVSTRRMLEQGLNPNTLNNKGVPVLYSAIQFESYRVAKALLDSPKLDVNQTSPQGETALMMAAFRGQTDLAKRLIERGAAVNRTGWTPLHYAATGGHLKMIELLLEHYAFIDAQAPNGNTPLMMAAYFGTPEAVKLLIEQGADVKMTNQSGKTALDFAQMAKHRNSAELITEALRRSQGVPRGQW